MRLNKSFLTLLLLTVVIFHERILHMVRSLVPQNVDPYNPNIRAFLMTIRACEGTSHKEGYNTLVGGTTFGDLSKHPNERKTLTIKDRTTQKTKTVVSTAAGAYQFINATWQRIAKKLNLPNFQPENQDRAALELIAERGAISDILKGDVIAASKKCSVEWASLPHSTAGQNPKSETKLKEYFIKYGGKLSA